jgi:hypothetical protein
MNLYLFLFLLVLLSKFYCNCNVFLLTVLSHVYRILGHVINSMLHFIMVTFSQKENITVKETVLKIMAVP